MIDFENLHNIVKCWFFAEILSHKDQDYEKIYGKPLDSNNKDYITDLIKYYLPDTEVHLIQKKNPFDYYLLASTKHCNYHSFAGTNGLKDWLCNADMRITREGMHRGWKNAISRFYGDIKPFVPNLKSKRNKMSGHSQGGPLTGYFARHLKLVYDIESEVWSYESPVWGNEKFCNDFAALGIKVNRVWCHGDPAVKYFQNIGKHYGQSIKLPIVNHFIQRIPFLRTYAHSYSLNTRALIKWCKKYRLYDEIAFLKTILDKAII